MIDSHIRQLASRPESAGPFLSLYLDTNRNDEAQRDRIRLLMKQETAAIREATERKRGDDEAIEKGIARIEEYVHNQLETSTRGLAIFVAPAEDFFFPLQLPVGVRAQLVVSSRPFLRPLIELRQSHPPAMIALVDGKYARLFELQFGQILREIDLENPDMPRRHDQGGWSQSNMQRHVQDHIDRHHKEVAEALTKLIERNGSGIVLSGQERNLANFRSFLSKRVDERVIGVLHLDIRSSVEEIAAGAQEQVQLYRQRTVGERLLTLEEAARKNGRGALGIGPVVNAVNERKLERLFISSATERQGWRCTSCSLIGEVIPLGCPACGAKVATADLVEMFISAAESEDAAVEVVPRHSLLEKYDGVGATLRF